MRCDIGKPITQIYVFDKSKWTKEQARKWVERKGLKKKKLKSTDVAGKSFYSWGTLHPELKCRSGSMVYIPGGFWGPGRIECCSTSAPKGRGGRK